MLNVQTLDDFHAQVFVNTEYIGIVIAFRHQLRHRWLITHVYVFDLAIFNISSHLISIIRFLTYWTRKRTNEKKILSE